MTIGENIQYHRKRLGLSQEDLGQKLNLSRQTVSLWENDQTQPTVDNFLRLKEIFGVSVDALLGCESELPKEEKPQPVESYRFTFSEEDNKIRYTTWIIALVRGICVPLFFLLFMLVCALTGNVTSNRWGVVTQHDFKDAVPIVVLILLVYIITAVRSCRKSVKLFQLRSGQLQGKTYEYNTFYNYFTVNIEKNNETTAFYKIYFEDIEQIEISAQFYSLTANGLRFDIPKRLLPENSFCAYLANSFPAKTKIVKKADGKAVVSAVLFAACFFVIPLALLLLKKLAPTQPGTFVRYMWLFFVPLPIPIASVVYGNILKKKQYYAYKKNIVIGWIMAIILCIYGCFTFIFADTYKNEAPMLNLEQYIETDLPQHIYVETTDCSDTADKADPDFSVVRYSTVHFDKVQAQEMEKALADDDRWLTARPTDLLDITNPLFRGNGYAYYLIYNITEDTFNTLPTQKGEQNFINAFYSKASRQLLIVEYSMDYR